jgi:hypothetical protein
MAITPAGAEYLHYAAREDSLHKPELIIVGN